MSDGIYVRLQYRDEICFEQKFRAISGDTIVLHIDDFIEQKVQEEREACAKVLDEMAAKDKLSNYYKVAALAIRARREQ